MVMIKTDGTKIEGKFGGTVFRSDQCGLHAQAAPGYSEREPSPKQLARQNAFRKCINYIHDNATIYMVASWQDYANHMPHKSRKGKIFSCTWFQMFIKYNINSVINGEPITRLPPGYEPEPTPP